MSKELDHRIPLQDAWLYSSVSRGKKKKKREENERKKSKDTKQDRKLHKNQWADSKFIDPQTLLILFSTPLTTTVLSLSFYLFLSLVIKPISVVLLQVKKDKTKPLKTGRWYLYKGKSFEENTQYWMLFIHSMCCIVVVVVLVVDSSWIRMNGMEW